MAAGESVVVHCAAGGVGSLAVQLGRAARRGPRDRDRLERGRSARWRSSWAPTSAIDPAPEGLTERLLEANGGRAVDVVFEMSGGEVFDASYRALAPFGRIVVYGIATSEPNEVRTGSLLRHSRAVVGFYLFHCLERPGMFAEALADLFARAARGELRAIVGAHLPARAGRPGADRPARAAHDRQAAARPDA